MRDGSMVSVIIPVWNARNTLAETLTSIAAQTTRPDEVILIDDGSTDGTEEVLAVHSVLPVQYVSQENSGPSVARNHGLERSSGAFVAFLDADDLWPADTLRLLTGALNQHPQAEIIQGKIQDLWPDPEGGPPQLGSPRFALNIGSALFRRSVFEKTGGFNPLMRTGEDFEFWLRCKEQGIERVLINDVTLHYRRKTVDRIDAKQHHFRTRLQVLKQSIDRSAK